MPSRLVTAAILVFWLAMTGWLIQREVVPSMLADASPTYQPDLTDEIGSPVLNWKIFRDGERIGSASSRVIANDDRSYDFQSGYLFNKFVVWPLQVLTIDQTYRVSDEGKLRSFLVKMEVMLLLKGMDRINGEMKADVIDGEYEPRFKLNNQEERLPNVEKAKVVQKGHFVNSMHLLNRLRGLREGRTWRITPPDLMGGLKIPGLDVLAKQSKGPTELVAVVEIDSLRWDGKEVACYKIDYRPPGKDDIVASTWVRKLDGLVLQQKASQMGIELVMQRMP